MNYYSKGLNKLSFIGNLLWIILGGLIAAILWLTVGLLLCVSIIGIPLGIQCFKMAGLALAPFGKMVDTDFDEHPIANIIWAIVAGWEMCLMYLTVGVILCITIIGIPFGKQWFKMARLTLFPFGADIR